MKNQKIITALVFLIAVFAAIAASAGVFSNAGTGIYEYESIRGETVDIYGRGVYKHMSADVAPQGIAQDVITLFAAIPLLDGTIVPVEAEHYTTLIVQGLDLALLLPVCFVSAVLYLKKYPIGYLLAPVYLIFLSLMMLALTSKVIAMGLLGQQIIPVIFIIPVFMLISIVLATLNIRAITR